MHVTSLILTFLLTSPTSILARKSRADSTILLSKVKTLTLYGDKKTSSRRVAAIPQLKCVGGNGCKHHKVDLMRCQNAGSEYDAEDIQWTCSASLPSDFKLGSTEVICEGYDNADDPWVLKGSCGVEYRLLLTDEGERKYGSNSKSTYRTTQEDYEEQTPTQGVVAKALFWIAFLAVLCFILYHIFNPPNGNGPVRLGNNNRRGWGGGGGGGDNGWDDPPPPYSPRPPTQPRAKPSMWTGSSSRNASGSSGPGFWTGAGTGAAAGYGAGYYHATRNAEAERRRERERERSSSWFGGGSRAGSGSSGRGGGGGFFSGSGGSSAPSSSRHESTGFGGTRRR